MRAALVAMAMYSGKKRFTVVRQKIHSKIKLSIKKSCFVNKETVLRCSQDDENMSILMLWRHVTDFQVCI